MSAVPHPSAAEAEARAFVDAHVARLAPLLAEANRAAWDAAVGAPGDPHERAARARGAVKRLLSDAAHAKQVRAWRHDGTIGDPQLRRQLVLLDHEFTANQLPPEVIDDLVSRATALEQVFHTHRAELEGERVSNNRLLEVLQTETDGAVRRAAWEASKQIGAEVAGPLRDYVRARNAAARSLGFADAYAMDLRHQEIDEATLFGVLDDFRDRTDEPFRRFRAELDARMAARHGVPPEALRPWHWEDFFGQEAPSDVGRTELDGWFEGEDVERLATEFFRGLDLPVEAVMARSDLYEREGKDQHAFCVDIDREGDVRILCNLRANEHWTRVLLHELGHAVYDAYLPRELPFLLRQPAHTLSTEAVAMYMGRLTRTPAWLRDVLGREVDPALAEDVRGQLRAAMLISTRWMLVMTYFERELYRNPDREDLNGLWWDLVERLQMVRRPDGRDAPDWAAKIHLSLSPVYYHNYLLGELMASQISAASRAGVPAGKSIAGEPSVGAFLRERIFAPGASLDWNALLVHATGEGLSPRHFVDEFV